jgi:DNA-binding XRE family transcriptional regulator
MHFMSDESDRLILAREAAGYRKATDAAEAMGVVRSTYLGHENGSRGLGRAAEHYAEFFRVKVDWLLYGKGSMKPGQQSEVEALYEQLRPEDKRQAIAFLKYLASRKD